MKILWLSLVVASVPLMAGVPAFSSTRAAPRFSVASEVRAAYDAPLPGVTSTQLPVAVSTSSEPWIAVDPVGKHVFVSAGPGTSAIYVLDFDGTLVKTITGESGASGMAVDTATHTLYVADYDATAIAEIDTQTLTETTRFSEPYAGPSDLALAGGKLWFATSTYYDAGVVASAGLDGSNITKAGFSGPVILAASQNGNLLATGTNESEPGSATVYDVSGGTPTVVGSGGDGGTGFVRDMAFDASGDNLLLAASTPASIEQISTSTFLSSASYPAVGYPVAVAPSADGNYVAGGESPFVSGATDVSVYPVGDTTAVHSWQLGFLFKHSLVFSPDGSRLFALSLASNNDLELDVLDHPTLHGTTTTLSGSVAAVPYGHSVKLTAHVTGTTTGSVELDAAPPGRKPVPIAVDPINGAGYVSFTVKPTEKTLYAAQLEAGSTYVSSSSAGVMVNVDPRLSVTARPTVAHVSGRGRAEIALTGVIVPSRSGPIGFLVQRFKGGKWLTVVTLRSRVQRGKAHTVFRTSQNGAYRVQADFNGDSKYGPGSSAWAKFSVAR